MLGINIELTTNCPLHCPQCYCTLSGGKNIPIDIAKNKVKEAAEYGVKSINLSGGETLCYPNIYELISYVSSLGIKPNVALSGWNFNEDVLEKLIESGIFGIFISLNGSTPELNSLSRNGYNYAIDALKLLQKKKYKYSIINWVMSSNNYYDFKNIIKIAEKYSIPFIEVIMIKPDSKNQLKTFPNYKQIFSVANEIKNYSGPVKIFVEKCFSQMYIMLKNIGYNSTISMPLYLGCAAAKSIYNISVDGKYTPCRHINIPEEFSTLDEYLQKSEIVKKIKDAENTKKEPCLSCKFNHYCRPCLAMNKKLKGDIYIGHDICDLWRLN